MSALELILQQLANAQFQITQAIDGLDAEHAEARSNELGMTIKEQIYHLTEAALAGKKSFTDEKYQWGSYAPEDGSWEGIKKGWLAIRAETVAAISEDEAVLTHAHEYLVAHDFYHVGQICAARRTVEPNWDTYAIYG